MREYTLYLVCLAFVSLSFSVCGVESSPSFSTPSPGGALSQSTTTVHLPASVDSSDLPTTGDIVLHVTVLKPDGKPAAHRRVLLVSVDRVLLVSPERAAKWAKWHYRTDSKGQFDVRFRREPMSGDQYDGDPGDPGCGIYGGFYLMVPEGRHDAGAVSSRLAPGEDALSYYANEWGQALSLLAPESDLTLHIKRGIALKGRVAGRMAKAAAGAEVRISYNLHAGTHTGYGGEVLNYRTRIGRSGRFSFPCLYPTTFTLHAEAPLHVLVKDGVQLNMGEDEIGAGPDGSTLNLDLVPHPGPRHIPAQ